MFFSGWSHGSLNLSGGPVQRFVVGPLLTTHSSALCSIASKFPLGAVHTDLMAKSFTQRPISTPVFLVI